MVNYDLPRSAGDYMHRIGRTGRAGESGMAVSFVSADTEAHFRLIEKRKDLRIVREVVAGFEPTELPTPVQRRHRHGQRRHQGRAPEQEGQTARSGGKGWRTIKLSLCALALETGRSGLRLMFAISPRDMHMQSKTMTTVAMLARWGC